MLRTVSVGMGEVIVSRDPGVELVCLGLGSCIAVCLYEPRQRLAAMAHVVLPTCGGFHSERPGKYADTAIPHLLREVRKNSADPMHSRVVLCGGAAIFPPINALVDIGRRNLVAVKGALRESGVAIVKQEVGGRESRTVRLSVETGQVRLRTVRTGEYPLVRLG